MLVHCFVNHVWKYNNVTPSSPAKKAGILGGDNVTDIKGRNITLGERYYTKS